ncbi:hypothetical protein TIFTF001_026985 [Ficus carica]|uniref:glyoxylate reductase (NADP(+)) n=1 Tax=Ficus carica TaxID=3494 RepID=A0AA88DM81_FICCA|nr:hypothetical protein TIFTF001_026985 [Ficus carica]
MAEPQIHHLNGNDRRPKVLMLNQSPTFALFPSLFTQKFRILKAWESEQPLDQFLAKHARSVHALLGDRHTVVNAELLQLLPALRMVTVTCTGVNQIDLAECRRRGIAVANLGGAYSEDVADFAVGLLIDVLRRVSASDRYVRKGFWRSKGDFPLGFKLGGKRIGIVGMGKIGIEVAKRLQVFGCSIAYTSRNKKPSISYPVYSTVQELAESSDAIILCCGLNDQTRHIVNKKVLSALGKEGVVINIGRGALIDEKELVRCLVGGEIGGAGLDVFENEPYVPKELFALDNVVLCPHRAVHTPESFQASAEIAIANLEAFFSNRPLITPVTND